MDDALYIIIYRFTEFFKNGTLDSKFNLHDPAIFLLPISQRVQLFTALPQSSIVILFLTDSIKCRN